ncbi:MAG: bacteriohemerythrin [Deltaproteobacteria bacterium]|jgi:hemerythrin-like metal-binding protein|nr:bacteriohemerythrin [Deltaproteobacteria bacterium]MBT4527226.1 bacteriohemerythrin [Deltaproteobacteria bacterium]
MKDLSISLKAKITFITAIIIAGGLVSLTLYYLHSSRFDAEVISLLERQNILSQKMAKSALGFGFTKNEIGNKTVIARELDQTKELFYSSLMAFKKGGRYNTDSNSSVYKELPGVTDQQNLDKINEIEAQYKDLIKHIDHFLKGNTSANRVNALVTEANKLSKLSNDLVLIIKNQGELRYDIIYTMTWITGVFILGLIGIFWYFLGVFVVKPVKVVLKFINTMKTGDLDTRFKSERNDEFGQIIMAINQLGDTLKHTIGEIIGNTETINALLLTLSDSSQFLFESTETVSSQSNTITKDSGKITANMDTVASSADKASNNVQMISSTIEQLSSNMDAIAASAEEMSVNMGSVSDNMSSVSTQVETVTSSVNQMSDSLKNISESTSKALEISEEASHNSQENLKAMSQLNHLTQQIDDVLVIIDKLAGQTNMLALNATIEAAGAGEAGKGFAVVASEVKQLSKQTGEASNKISEQIDTIQQHVQISMKHTEDVGKVINEITDINKSISGLVKEQNINSEQIVKSIDEVSNAAKDSSVNVTEAAIGVQDITRSTNEASLGAKDAARSSSDAATGVADIATSSATSAESIRNIDNAINAINFSISEAGGAAKNTMESVGKFTEMAKNLKRSVEFFSKGGSTFFYWFDQLDVGHSELNEQHKEIIKYINILAKAHQTQQTDKVSEDLTALIKITTEHFNSEEKLYLTSDYPDKELHSEKHNEILQQLGDFQNEFEKGNRKVDHDFLEFIKEWLQVHIMSIDKSYRNFI